MIYCHSYSEASPYFLLYSLTLRLPITPTPIIVIIASINNLHSNQYKLKYINSLGFLQVCYLFIQLLLIFVSAGNLDPHQCHH